MQWYETLRNWTQMPCCLLFDACFSALIRDSVDATAIATIMTDLSAKCNVPPLNVRVSFYMQVHVGDAYVGRSLTVPLC